MTVIDARKTVGQLVAERPSRAQFFDQVGIDYGCGGRFTLAQACVGCGLDMGRVLSELETCDHEDGPPATDEFEPTSLEASIGRIVAVHHGHLRRELPRLAAILERVAEAHGQEHPELGELREIFAGLKSDLEKHMVKEEWSVFPLIKRLESARSAGELPSRLGALMSHLEQEHLETARVLARIRRLTGEYRTPADACPLYRVLLGGLAGLEADLHHHVHEENHVLFPRARARAAALPASAQGASEGAACCQ